MDSFPSPASAADGFSSLNAGIFFDDARSGSRCAPVSARREGAAEPCGREPLEGLAEELVELSADAPCVLRARSDGRCARGTAEAPTLRSFGAKGGARVLSTGFGLSLSEAERIPALFFPRRPVGTALHEVRELPCLRRSPLLPNVRPFFVRSSAPRFRRRLPSLRAAADSAAFQTVT